VQEHISRFINARHHGIKFRPRGWNRLVLLEFGTHLFSGYGYGMVISLKELNSGSIQTTKAGEDASSCY
jgi:hypothetical protein